MAMILEFPTPLMLTQLMDNLYLMKLNDTPEAQAQADRLVKELRANNMIVPQNLRGK